LKHHRVAVAVAARFPDENLEDCLACSEAQARHPDEVIVVGPFKNPEMEARWPDVTFLQDDGNRSKARNVAWRSTDADIVCFWEADSIFNEKWIEEVLRAFDRGADAVIDRRRVYRPRTYFQRSWDKQFDLRYAHYVPFSAWAFRRRVLSELGGFDETLEYAEDTDLGLRLKAKKYKILLAEGAVQFHKGEPQSLISMIRRRFRFGYNKAKGFYRKNPSLYPWGKSAASLGGVVLSLLLMLTGRFLLLVMGALVGFAVVEIVIAIKYKGLVPLMLLPGIALNRICGGISYYLGVVSGSLMGAGKTQQQRC